MNSYGVGGVEVTPTRTGYMSSCDTGISSSRPAARRSSALPDPSLYDTYAREQSPLSDDEMREAAAFHFGVALDAS